MDSSRRPTSSRRPSLEEPQEKHISISLEATQTFRLIHHHSKLSGQVRYPQEDLGNLEELEDLDLEKLEDLENQDLENLDDMDLEKLEELENQDL